MEQMPIFDINKICRVCLEEGMLVSIYSTEYAISPLDMIVGCTNVKITDTDELPSSICQNCIYRLGVAYQFKQQCENSDMRLRECLGLEIPLDVDDENGGDNDVKNEKPAPIVLMISTDSTYHQHHQLQQHHQQQQQQIVSNNDSATQVKDEEIFAAMNAVCEMFGNNQTAHVALLQHDENDNMENAPENSNSSVSLMDTAQHINEDDRLIATANYLAADTLPEDIIIADTFLHDEIVPDHHHLLDEPLLAAVENDHDVHADILAVVPVDLTETDVEEALSRDVVYDKDSISAVTNETTMTTEVIHSPVEQAEPPEVAKESTKPHSRRSKKKQRGSSSKAHKSREDLDHFLQQQKAKRTAQKASVITTKDNDGGKRLKRLLKQPDQCFDCGKTFAYSGYLDAHMRTHTGERPYHCRLCKLRFAQTGNLALHMRVHTGERPYQCEVCSKLFTTSSNLKAHQRIHSEVRDFKCGQCDRAFKSTSELVSHAGTHTGVKNHVCKMCGKAFYKTSYLNVHVRTVHVGEKRHRCSECGKDFSNSSNLTCHFRIHTGEKPFPCKFCDARFNQSSALIRHTKQHTAGYFRPLKSKKATSPTPQSDDDPTLEIVAHCQSGSISDEYKTVIGTTMPMVLSSSYTSYAMKMPDDQHQLGMTDDFEKSTTMLDYSKGSSDYDGFNAINI